MVVSSSSINKVELTSESLFLLIGDNVNSIINNVNNRT